MIKLLNAHHLFSSKPILLDKNINIKDLLNDIKNMEEYDSYSIIHKYGTTTIVKNQIGIFGGTCPHYIKDLQEFKFENIWFIDKPNIRILNKIYEINKKYFDIYETEFFIPVYWNKKKKEYEIILPNQKVKSLHVEFDWLIEGDLIKVIDLHSHGKIESFFSGTDDKNDSLKFKLSFVIGNSNKICSRLVINSIAYDIEVYDIFDVSNKKQNFNVQINEIEKNIIKKGEINNAKFKR